MLAGGQLADQPAPLPGRQGRDRLPPGSANTGTARQHGPAPHGGPLHHLQRSSATSRTWQKGVDLAPGNPAGPPGRRLARAGVDQLRCPRRRQQQPAAHRTGQLARRQADQPPRPAAPGRRSRRGDRGHRVRRRRPRRRQRRRIGVQRAQPHREQPADQPGPRGEPGQPARTVDAGRPSPAAIFRCPAPPRWPPAPPRSPPPHPPAAAGSSPAAAHASPRSPRTATAAGAAASRSRPHPGSPARRACPHPASRPEHPGQRNRPAASRRSTTRATTPTVTIGASAHLARPSRHLGQEKDGRAAAYPDVITVASHTKKDNPAGLPSRPSSPSTAPGRPYVLTRNAAGQLRAHKSSTQSQPSVRHSSIA